jgi:DNA-binding NarL/FixJ family response regulator
VFAAMRTGARGYLLKGAEPAETLRAIRAVASGEAIFSPGIAERVMHYLRYLPDNETVGIKAICNNALGFCPKTEGILMHEKR